MLRIRVGYVLLLYLNISVFLNIQAVEYVNLQRCDRMTMANSLEARVPFFDVDYIATAMKVC